LAKTKTFPAQFIAVDLDIKSRSDLSVLVREWENRASLQYVDNSSNRHWLRVHLYSEPKDPAEGIRRFARLVRGLPRQARTTWARASSKEFDVGIQAGYEANAGEWVFESEVLKTVADLGGRLRLTVYSPMIILEKPKRRTTR
jgi:hypothetical protein